MEPQKAMHLYLEEEKRWPKYRDHEYMMFEKYDGWYGYKDSGKPIMSRSMRAIPSVEWLNPILECYPHGRMIFEIMVKNTSGFHELNGILNRTVGDYLAHGAYLIMHDFILPNGLNIPFYTRYNMLWEIVKKLRAETDRVILAQILGESKCVSTWKETAQDVWAEGGEGIILKRTSAPYSPGKRNYDLMKIKEEVTLDLLVTSMTEGEGKYIGTLGSLICRTKNGKLHNVSGMTDTERNAWWDDPKDIIGKVIEVKAMKLMPDGSLREPRFKSIRFDKTVKDID